MLSTDQSARQGPFSSSVIIFSQFIFLCAKMNIYVLCIMSPKPFENQWFSQPTEVTRERLQVFAAESLNGNQSRSPRGPTSSPRRRSARRRRRRRRPSAAPSTASWISSSPWQPASQGLMNRVSLQFGGIVVRPVGYGHRHSLRF